MKDIEAAATSLSYDDLLRAVSESSQGRWFLDEYQRRLRKAETGDILSAINRIESRIADLSGGVASGELTRTKAAINATRADIANLTPAKGLSDEVTRAKVAINTVRDDIAKAAHSKGLSDEVTRAKAAINAIQADIAKPAPSKDLSDEATRTKAAINDTRADIAKPASSKDLSDEGRLFASLAELARKTQPAEKATAEIATEIMKAMKLVDELSTTSKGSAVKSEKYFKQDRALFEPVAPAPKPALVARTPAQMAAPITVQQAKPIEDRKLAVETSSQGAKLVIFKSGVKVEEPSSAIIEAPIAAAPAKAEPVKRLEPIAIAETKRPETALPVEKISNPRIVIIRRKPEEMTEVPLADEARSENSA